MLRLDVDIEEDFQLDTELTLHNIEYFLRVLLLGLGKADLILIICIFGLSETYLIAL